MASRLKVLVLDNEARWRDEVHEALLELGKGVETRLCADLKSAKDSIQATRFDLAILDLSLLELPEDLEEPPRPEEVDDLGIQVLASLRESRQNRHCGVLILTGYPTTERSNVLLKQYSVYQVLEKGVKYTDQALREAARGALREARARGAEVFLKECPTITLQIGGQGIKAGHLRAGSKISNYTLDSPKAFSWEPLAKYADLIERSFLSDDHDSWREHVQQIATLFQEQLARTEGVREIFAAGKHEASSQSRIRYRFETPTEALGTPFEMLRHGQKSDPICLEGPVTRQVIYPGQITSKTVESLHSFLMELGDKKRTLQVLLVAANVNNDLPGADAEVAKIEMQLDEDFSQVGISVRCEVLSFHDATYERINQLLTDGTFHIFHYAGHGLHRVDLPEASGLVLRDEDGGVRVLTASDLKSMLEKTELRLAFLNCCLGARTATRVSKGDFQGTVEALARGGVPIVLGYRWTVDDSTAAQLALSFYRNLSVTFSADEALFRARTEIARGKSGRDNPTWMSPVLLSQS